VKSEMAATLEEIIKRRRAQGLPAAGDVAAMDKGEGFMDQIRTQVADAQDAEEHLLRERPQPAASRPARPSRPFWPAAF